MQSLDTLQLRASSAIHTRLLPSHCWPLVSASSALSLTLVGTCQATCPRRCGDEGDLGPCSGIADMLTNFLWVVSTGPTPDPKPEWVSPLSSQHGMSGSFSPSDWKQSKAECTVQWDERLLHTLTCPHAHLTQRCDTHPTQRESLCSPRRAARRTRATNPSLSHTWGTFS